MTPFDGSTVSWVLLGAFVAAGLTLTGLGARWASPPMATFGGLLAAGAVFWATGPAWAGDAAELVQRAEARGRAAEAALREWTAEVGRRGDAYEAQARALAAGNAGRLQAGFSYLDGGDLFGRAADLAQDEAAREEAGVVYVAVSFSMAPEALRALSVETRKAGAVLVVRGFVGGSVPKTLAAARTAFDENAASGVAIDPQVFRAFQIERVPAFITARAPVEPCEGGIDCTSPAPAHDRLAGNISLTEALRLLAAKGRDAPVVARSALARLER